MMRRMGCQLCNGCVMEYGVHRKFIQGHTVGEPTNVFEVVKVVTEAGKKEISMTDAAQAYLKGLLGCKDGDIEIHDAVVKNLVQNTGPGDRPMGWRDWGRRELLCVIFENFRLLACVWYTR